MSKDKFFKMVNVFISTILLLSLFVNGAPIVAMASMPLDSSDSAQDSEVSVLGDEFVEVFSYKSILQDMYDAEVLSGELNQSEVSFSEYCASYVDPSLAMDQVTADSAETYQLALESQVQPRSNSDDEDYILKGINDPELSSFDPTYTPSSAFQRSVTYADRNMYSLLQEGDIVLETKSTNALLGGVLNNPGHTAYIYNTAKSGAYGNYIQTIEAVGGGVQFGFLDDARMITFGVVILRPTNTDSEIVEAASEFHYAQLNKPYAFSFTEAKTDINASQWYCSELTNAAYSYAGVNFNAVNSAGNVMPYDILHSSRTKYVRYGKYLDIRISKNYGVENGYTLEIYNYTGSAVTVEYNSKMCFVNDAKNWTGLSDVKTVTLNHGSMTRVNIYTNLAADAVAISYVSGGVRYITYGTELRSGSYLMATYKSRVTA